MFALQVNAVTEPPKTKDGEISSPFVFGGSLVPSTPYSGKRLRRRRRIFRLRGIPTRPVVPQTDAVPVPQRALRANGAFDPDEPAFLKKIRYGVSNAPLENTSKRHPIRTKVSKGGREPRRGFGGGGKYGGPLWGKAPLLLHQAFISSASKRSCRRSAAPYRARRRA